jgi:hypothetical protein
MRRSFIHTCQEIIRKMSLVHLQANNVTIGNELACNIIC